MVGQGLLRTYPVERGRQWHAQHQPNLALAVGRYGPVIPVNATLITVPAHPWMQPRMWQRQLCRVHSRWQAWTGSSGVQQPFC